MGENEENQTEQAPEVEVLQNVDIEAKPHSVLDEAVPTQTPVMPSEHEGHPIKQEADVSAFGQEADVDLPRDVALEAEPLRHPQNKRVLKVNVSDASTACPDEMDM